MAGRYCSRPLLCVEFVSVAIATLLLLIAFRQVELLLDLRTLGRDVLRPDLRVDQLVRFERERVQLTVLRLPLPLLRATFIRRPARAGRPAAGARSARPAPHTQAARAARPSPPPRPAPQWVEKLCQRLDRQLRH